MKAKNVSKIMTILIITIMFLLIVMPRVCANGYSNNITQWTFDNPQLPPLFTQVIGAIIAFLRNVSIIVTVVVITILGVKYMIGSVDQKAEYKKDYVNIVIGAVLISGIFSLVSAVFATAQGFF